MVSTTGFRPVNVGSIPAEVTIRNKKPEGLIFITNNIQREVNPQGSLSVGAEQKSKIYFGLFEATPRELVRALARTKFPLRSPENENRPEGSCFIF